MKVIGVKEFEIDSSYYSNDDIFVILYKEKKKYDIEACNWVYKNIDYAILTRVFRSTDFDSTDRLSTILKEQEELFDKTSID